MRFICNVDDCKKSNCDAYCGCYAKCKYCINNDVLNPCDECFCPEMYEDTNDLMY